jgi:hypothetical protein
MHCMSTKKGHHFSFAWSIIKTNWPRQHFMAYSSSTILKTSVPTSEKLHKASTTKTQILWLKYINMRFQVLTAASMKFRFVFWDVLPCKIIVDRRFRGMCCLHPQGLMYISVTLTHPWWWRQYAPLKRWSTVILHGSTSQKTVLNIILTAVRTWNLTTLYSPRYWKNVVT